MEIVRDVKSNTSAIIFSPSCGLEDTVDDCYCSCDSK